MLLRLGLLESIDGPAEPPRDNLARLPREEGIEFVRSELNRVGVRWGSPVARLHDLPTLAVMARVDREPLAHSPWLGYDTRAMLSRAQEARVRDVLANHPPGTIQTYCLEHLAGVATIPPGHLADLAALIRGLREHGQCEMQHGGTCDAVGHETNQLLVWGSPPGPVAQGLTS